jgi:putative membrane protein
VDKLFSSRLTFEGEAASMRNFWLVVFFATLVWSGIHPKDYLTWVLEVLPALIGLSVMAITRHKFPLTTLTYVLILIHCVILMVGGHYTYAEVPLFDWIRDWFHLERNNYDKVGHFVQGFVPAIIAREILLRNAIIAGKNWLSFIVVCICLAISAFYELIEWWVAIMTGDSAEAFLGTQGYVWDTQSDMMYALAGAIAALVLLSRIHDRQLSRYEVRGTRVAD